MVPEIEKLLFTGIQTFLFIERTEMSLTVGVLLFTLPCKFDFPPVVIKMPSTTSTAQGIPL